VRRESVRPTRLASRIVDSRIVGRNNKPLFVTGFHAIHPIEMCVFMGMRSVRDFEFFGTCSDSLMKQEQRRNFPRANDDSEERNFFKNRVCSYLQA
jgi:hypothetical protein